MVMLSLFVQCKNTNWKENYREREKSPFGTYIIFNEMSSLLDNEEVHYLKVNIEDYLLDNYEDEKFSNYICIKDAAPKLDDQAIDKLLGFVSDGNTAFIALNSFPEYLKEKLEFETKERDSLWYSDKELKVLSGSFTLENKAFDLTALGYDRNITGQYFSAYNSGRSIVLGTQDINTVSKANYIKIYYGKGLVYLHSQPIAFTNYYMLKNTVKYTENVFSYLPSAPTLWDPQIRKSSLSQEPDNSPEKDSVFKYFLAHSSLKWSLFLAMGSLLLFMLFNARRKQRPIPILPKVTNATVAFTQTISNLYLKENNPKNLVDKKITYFLEAIRTQFLLDTSNLNERFIELLALKSGNEISSTRYLIKTIRALRGRSECSNEELMRLNSMIEIYLKQ